MKINELREKKWRKFLRRARLFRFVPFVDFVLAAGSLATGKLHRDSDFDVIVGCRQGKIFTARMFSIVIFGIPGWRRRKLTHGEVAADKICFNHFVTPNGYKLKGPYNKYWQDLYHSLVPVMGDREEIDLFFKANNWLKPKRIYSVRSHKANPFYINIKEPSSKSFCEDVLSGAFGSWLEGFLKNIQIKRIKKGLSKNLGYKPRVVYNDYELEFHPDTKRIEEMLKNKS